MKLYSTVTSECASKGQGGNVLLEVTLQRERNKLSHIVEYTSDTLTVFSIRNSPTGQMIGKDIVYQEKGEKQKGEECASCWGMGGNCPTCKTTGLL